MARGVCAYLVLCYLMVLSRQETQSFLKRPYGIKMCADFCLTLIGCSSYTFSHQELSCRVNYGPTFRHRDERQYFINEDTNGIAKDFSETCPHSSRLLLKRTQRLVCIDRKDPEKRLMKNASMRLLVVTQNYKAPLRQIYLQNYTMKPYPYIGKNSIKAVMYAPKLRRILLGLSTRKMVSWDLDKYNNTVLKRKVLVKSIAVDESKRLVFLSTTYPKVKVGVMTTEGRHFRYIDVRNAHCRYMSVDSKRQRLFLWLYYYAKLVMTTYNGTNITHMCKIKGYNGGMTFDYDRNQLYVHVSRSLMVISFPNQTTTATTLPYTQGSSLYYHGGTIYAVLPKAIITLKLGNKNIIPHTELSTKGLFRVVGVC